MVIDHDDADDITQNVFIKLHSSLKDFRGDSALFTYLYKMTVNYSLNFIKKNKNRQMKEIADTNEISKIPADDYRTSSYDTDYKNRIIEEAISALPAQQRAVFNMRFYDELTYEEISSILKKSTGGLKANYFHAFRKIKDFLKDKKNKGEF